MAEPKCPKCGGTGRDTPSWLPSSTCEACNGTGLALREAAASAPAEPLRKLLAECREYVAQAAYAKEWGILRRIDAALAAPAVSAWRPISESPKGQIRIIGARPDIVLGDIYYGPAAILLNRLADQKYTAERLDEAWRYTDSGDKLLPHQQPTHFQELPAPPEPK